jgi:hypothetical protein
MIKEMIKELNVMVDNSMIRPTLASKAIEYISVNDINEIEDFDSMSTSEAVDYVLDIVRYS